MKIDKLMTDEQWKVLPRRQRTVPPEILEIVGTVEGSDDGSWIVVELDEDDKRRLQTIRRQISTQAVLRGFGVDMEMRGGDLGVRREI